MNLQSVQTWSLHQPVGQLRAWPICLGRAESPEFLVAYSADFDVDP